jgi:hypothetical protein
MFFANQNETQQLWSIDVKEWQTTVVFALNSHPSMIVVGVEINVMCRMNVAKEVTLLVTLLQ